MSDSSWSHESRHARPTCPSPTPGVHSNSCPSSWWCHPAISSSVVPLLLLPPIPPNTWIFSNESTLCMRWPKYWSFSFSIGPSSEDVCQGCILSPCLFNLYAEYIIRNAGLEETQAGIKIARRNINNLRYADDTTLMAESEEELKSLLVMWKTRMKKLA